MEKETNRAQEDSLKSLFRHVQPDAGRGASGFVPSQRDKTDHGRSRTDTQTQRTLGMDCRHRRLAAYGRYRNRFIPLYEYFPNIRTDPQYEHTPLLCLYRDACPHPAGSRLQIQATIQKEADVSERKDVSSGITSPKDCFFHAKSLASQKKALPLPRFLRDDNIMSNLLIKTNLSINN